MAISWMNLRLLPRDGIRRRELRCKLLQSIERGHGEVCECSGAAKLSVGFVRCRIRRRGVARVRCGAGLELLNSKRLKSRNNDRPMLGIYKAGPSAVGRGIYTVGGGTGAKSGEAGWVDQGEGMRQQSRGLPPFANGDATRHRAAFSGRRVDSRSPTLPSK